MSIYTKIKTRLTVRFYTKIKQRPIVSIYTEIKTRLTVNIYTKTKTRLECEHLHKDQNETDRAFTQRKRILNGQNCHLIRQDNTMWRISFSKGYIQQ